MEELQKQIQELKDRMDRLESKPLQSEEVFVDIENIRFPIQTISVAADLTAKLASKPNNFYEQIVIDCSTATKKLYIYEMDSSTNPPTGTWRSCTIT